MTQKTKPRIVIDTNKHGIRRETNLDKPKKKKSYPQKKKLNEVRQSLSTDIDTKI